jgi:ATP-dependent RNA helicase DDX56/DBP9
VLTSATLSEDVTKLKRLVLHNPVTLKLEEPALPEATQLTQYQIR